MIDKIDKSVLEQHKGNNTLPSDLRLKLLETIGVVNELCINLDKLGCLVVEEAKRSRAPDNRLIEQMNELTKTVADIVARQQAAAGHIIEGNQRDKG